MEQQEGVNEERRGRDGGSREFGTREEALDRMSVKITGTSKEERISSPCAAQSVKIFLSMTVHFRLD